MTHALTKAFGVVSLWTLDARGMTKGGNFRPSDHGSIRSQERGCFIWVDGGSLSEPLNPDLPHLPHQANHLLVLLPRMRLINSLLSKVPEEGRVLAPLPPSSDAFCGHVQVEAHEQQKG